MKNDNLVYTLIRFVFEFCLDKCWFWFFQYQFSIRDRTILIVSYQVFQSRNIL